MLIWARAGNYSDYDTGANAREAPTRWWNVKQHKSMSLRRHMLPIAPSFAPLHAPYRINTSFAFYYGSYMIALNEKSWRKLERYQLLLKGNILKYLTGTSGWCGFIFTPGSFTVCHVLFFHFWVGTFWMGVVSMRDCFFCLQVTWFQQIVVVSREATGDNRIIRFVSERPILNDTKHKLAVFRN